MRRSKHIHVQGSKLAEENNAKNMQKEKANKLACKTKKSSTMVP